MKALSVKQPWASLLVHGIKTGEVRTWKTKHKGPLLIVSSQQEDRKAMEHFNHVPGSLPAGKAIGIVDVWDCREFTKGYERFALRPFVKDAYIWLVRNPRKIEPFAVSGRLGMFEIEYTEK